MDEAILLLVILRCYAKSSRSHVKVFKLRVSTVFHPIVATYLTHLNASAIQNETKDE